MHSTYLRAILATGAAAALLAGCATTTTPSGAPATSGGAASGGATLALGCGPRRETFPPTRGAGDTEEGEMRRTFNLGLGMVLAVEAGGADTVLRTLRAHGVEAAIVGEVVASDAVDDDRVTFVGA